MYRKLLSGLFSLFLFTSIHAKLLSPEFFLGYKIGSRYTPHHKLMAYYNHALQNAPDVMKLQEYGLTNEQRPLMLAFISSPENISNLENIRLNNLRLASLSKDKAAPQENTPAIVWLSYNVHGNETSSSEASMLTLYALLDPQNKLTKEWLKNTVVIIDPCLNPDGRDRYVNWYNSIAGVNHNAQTDTREHREPWPGGRTNHYNFDLNRDWAWQTQIESRQRIKQYLQWMPQIHVDFHEQGINQPYYFAPAAQPYHEAITRWQRDFQITIGKNHAKYFDKNGWLYFTREIFDLLYPSYGDTYPTYNGGIGMTYEQGGGPSAGKAVITDEGDTLTLYDRALHHHTTGLSTIEVASVHGTALIKEFRKYFLNVTSGVNTEYKSYIVKNKPADAERISALLKLLDKNGIEYANATPGSGRGFNYYTGKEESFPILQSDIVISALQPRGTMVKVLFESQTKLADSMTYDITAWSLPFAYGLQSYALKTVVPAAGVVLSPVVNNNLADAYGYIIRWQGVASASAVAALLQQGIKLRFAETGFEVTGKAYGPGSVIILKKGNESWGASLWNTVGKTCNEYNIKPDEVSTGMVDKGFDFGSSKVHPMKAPRVVLLTGEGIGSNAAGEVWHFFDQELRYPLSLVNVNDINRLNWRSTDVLIMPDGNYRFLNDKNTTEQFSQWIRNGGRVVALESAVAQLSKQEWSVVKQRKEDEKEKDSDTGKNSYELLKVYEDREKDEISNITPGSVFKVQTDNSHPLLYGYPDFYYTLKMDNTVYDFIKENGWNAGVIKKEGLVAGFVGSRLAPRLKDGLIFGVQEMGSGSITYLTDDVLFRNFWENGKLMFCNAVFIVGQ